MLMEVGREHQPVAEVLVVGEHELVIEVSHHGVGEIGLNPLDEVAVVDPALNPVLAERHERDRPDASLPLLVARDHDRVRVRHQRRLEAAVRRQPHLELPLLRVRGRGHDHVAVHVPGEVAADELLCALLAGKRIGDGRAVAAAGRAALTGSLAQRVVKLRRARVVVDRPRVADDLVGGPVAARRVVLSRCRDVALGARVGDGLQVLAAHRPERCLQQRPRIFFLGGGRRIADREQRADQEHPQLASHVPPFFEEMMAAQREVGRVGRGSGE